MILSDYLSAALLIAGAIFFWPVPWACCAFRMSIPGFTH